MTIWCVTTSPENVAKTASLGWVVQGFKERRRNMVERMRPGDKLVYYATKVAAFPAVAEVTSEMFESREPVWTSNPGETYPWRVHIRPEVVLDAVDDWVPAEELLDELEHVRKWPRQNWKLAFQGNLREWPEGDYLVVRKALEHTAGSE